MNELQQKVFAVLSRYAGKRFIIGVSGGRDSMCLLHAAVNCGAVNKSDILCVHVNHGLRDEADSDMEFVRGYCLGFGVRFKAIAVNVREYAKDNALSVEQAARDLRYDAFYGLIKSGEGDLILTAHHALDNAETVLMHMFRGAGLDGLCGIKSGGQIVRPLLSVMPDELDDYARTFGINHVVDKTNFCDDADRNFIRLNVMPLILRRYSGAVGAINALSAECAGACDFLNGAMDKSLVRFADGAAIVADNALLGPLSARYVRYALSYFSLTDVTRDMINRAASLVYGRTGALVELANGVAAAREYGGVAFYLPRPQYCGELPVKLGANFIDGLSVAVGTSDGDPKSAKGRYLDLDKIAGCVLRFRRDGDMFKPFGGKSKKLKQYFIDNKIPSRLRGRIPLICRGNEVLVVVGYEISDRVGQTEKTVNRGEVFLRW